jgi:hypothetical protein
MNKLLMEKEEYKPGVCNIGHEEVAIRKATFYIILTAMFTWLIYTLLVPVSVLNLAVLFMISIAMSISFLQYRNRFCIKYGWLYQFNFGKRGLLQKVIGEDHRKSDRKKVLEILTKSILFSSLLVATVYFLLTAFA